MPVTYKGMTFAGRDEWLAYRRAEGKPGKSPCLHLGADTGERRLCPSCKGHVEVKLLACAVHGKCSVQKPIQGVQCCSGCQDYKGSK